MWVCTTFVYLVPAVIVTIQVLSPQPATIPEQTLNAIPGITWERSSPPDAEVVS